MVVQETATSNGKGASGATGRACGSSGSASFSSSFPFSFSASARAVLTALAVLAPIAAWPQIIADPSAPGGQRPTVLAAPNGVPVINIQRASAAGVSRNTYSQFDIGRSGAVLNNSPSTVSTQLAGTVGANPWLSAPAQVILNEVNSPNPSYLRGYVEVGGARAEVILANPSGIQVDGGGFINASRVTLTTGTPQLGASGTIESFLVRGGTIVIDGQGLDLTRVDYSAILSRALSVNAGLWANQLEIITGANAVNVLQRQVSLIAGTGPTPAFSLDVAALGGMYAGKILLMGSEAGVGVRNAGTLSSAPANLAAGQSALSGIGEFVITSAGRLENLGTIQASGRADLTAMTLGNSGTIASATSLKVRTEGELANSLNGRSGQIEAPRLDLASTSGDINNQGATIRQTSAAALTLTAPVLSNTAGGVIGAEPAPAPTPSTGTSTGTGTGTGTGAGASSGTGTTTPTDGSTATGPGTGVGTATPPAPAPAPAPGALTAAGTIRNDGGHIYAGGPIAILSQNVNNNGGTLTLADLTLTQPTFDNHNGTLNVGNFNAHVERFDNTAGTLHAGHLQVVTTGDLINVDGKLLSDAETSLSVGGLLNNTRGTASAVGALSATVAGSANNSAGTLTANQSLTLSTAALDNRQGTVQSSQANTQLKVTNLLQNTDGLIGAGLDLGVAAGTLAGGNGTLRATRDTTVSVVGALTSEGSITAARHTTLTANSFVSGTASVLGAGIHNDGTLATSGNLAVTTTGALTAGGQNLAPVRVTFQGAAVDLSGSQTYAGTIALTATQGNVATSGATVSTPGTLSLNANANSDQTLVNVNGKVTAGQLDLHAANITNTQAGQLVQTGPGATTLITGIFDNSGGLLASNGRDLSLQAATVTNTAGEISHAGVGGAPGTLVVDTGSYSGAGGTMITNGALVVRDSGAFVQDGGSTRARQITMDVASLSSQAGGKIVQTGDGATRITASGALNNNAGLIQSNGLSLTLQAATLTNSDGMIAHSTGNASGVLDITATTRLDNRQGDIVGNGVLALHGGAVGNEGGAINAQQIALDAASLRNESGQIVQGGTGATRIAVTGLLDNNAGLIASKGQDFAIGAGTLTNVQGSIQHAIDTGSGARGTLAIAAASVDNTRGEILANSALQITTGVLGNSTGTLSAAQIGLAAASLNNQAGKILQSGSDDTRIVVSGAIDNSAKGLIASNANNVTLTAGGTLNNTGGTVQHAGIGMLAISTGALANDKGDIVSNGALALKTGAFGNNAGAVSANLVAVDALSLTNQAGQIVQLGQGATRIAVAGALDNSAQGLIATNGETFNLSSASLNNQGGTVQHAGQGAFDLTTGALSNNTGLIVSNGALALKASAIDNNAGTLSAQQLMIDAASLSNQHGQVTQNGTGATRIAVAGLLDNSGAGLISSAGSDFTLGAGTLNNATGSLQHAGTGAFNLITGALANNAGLIVSNGALAIHAGDIGNQVGVISAKQLSLDAASLSNQAGQVIQSGTGATRIAVAGLLDNTADGLIASNGLDMTLSATTLLNTGGNVEHAGMGTFALTARDMLNNARGTLASNGDLVVQTGTFGNNAGHVTANQLTLDARSLTNQAGQIVQLGQGATHIAVAGLLDNSARGLIATNGAAFSLSAGALNNDSGTVQHAGQGAFDLTTTTLTNRAGLIVSNGALTLQATDVQNNTGTLTANRITADVSNLNNQHGQIVQNGSGATRIAVTHLLDNSAGGLIASAGTDFALASGTLNNAVGSVQHAGTSTLALTTGALSNEHGEILGNGALVVRAGAIGNNAGTIAARQVSIDAASLSNQAGSLTQSGTGTTRIAVVGLLDNTARGVIASNGAEMVLSAATLLNSTGQIAHAGKGTFDLTARDLLHNVRGDIASNGALAIRAGVFGNDTGHVTANRLAIDALSLTNQAGQIVQLGQGTTRIAVAGVLDNSAKGVIATNGESFSLGAGSLNNEDGVVQHAGHGGFALTTGELSNNTGLIVSNGALALQASAIDNNAGIISAYQVAIDAASLNNRHGQLTQNGIGATHIAVVGALDNSAAGLIASRGVSMTLSAGTLDNQTGSIQHAGTGAFALTSGALANAHGRIVSNGALTAHAGDIGNQAGVISAKQLSLDAASLNNQTGQVLQSGTGATRIAVAGALDNSAHGLIASNGLDMTLSVTTLLNSTGQIEHAGQGAFALTARDMLNNTRGDIVSNGALSVGAGAFDNDAGHVTSKQLTVDALSLSNQTGQMMQLGQGVTRIAVTGAIDNSAQGLIATNGDTFSLSSASLNNQSGTVQHAGHGAFDLTTGALANNAGLIVSNGALTLAAAAVQNTAGTLSAAQLSLDAQSLVNQHGQVTQNGTGATHIAVAGLLDNSAAGLIASRGVSMTLSAGTLDNQTGSIQHAGTGAFALTSGPLTNAHGLIVSNGALGMHAGNIGNQAGVISAKQLSLDAASLNNQTGQVLQSGTGATRIAVAGALDNSAHGLIASSGSDMVLSAGGVLTNADGQIKHAGTGTLAISSGSLANDRGEIDSNGALVVTTGAFGNNAGHVTANLLTVDAQSLISQAGRIVQVGKSVTHIAVTGALDNSAKGVIATNGESFGLSSGSLNNDDGIVQHAGHGGLTLTTGALGNRSGLIVSNGVLALTAADVQNTAGTLSGAQLGLDAQSLVNQRGQVTQNGTGATRIAVAGLLDNSAAGLIASQGRSMTLSAGTLNNATGNVQHAGTGAFTLSTGTLANEHGLVLSNGALALTASDIGNQAGMISARQLGLEAASLNNQAGQVTQSGTGATRMAVTGALDNSAHGLIASNGVDLTLTVGGALTNTDGQIQHAGTGTLAIASGSLVNDRGDIDSNGALVVTSGSFGNNAGHVTAKQLTLDVQSLANQAGRIVQLGQGATHIVVAGALDNSAKGLIASNGVDMTLRASTLTNATGVIQHAGSGRLDLAASTRLDNAQGSIVSNGALALQGGAIGNNAGLIAAHQLTLDVASLSNRGGQLVQSTSSKNSAPTLIAVAGLLDNGADGLIASNARDMTLRAGTLSNGGRIEHSGDGTLDLTLGQSTNAAGHIVSNNVMAIHGGAIGNDAGFIDARYISLDAVSLSNRGGHIVQSGTEATTLRLSGNLDNDGGWIASNGQNLSLSAASMSNNDGHIVHTATGAGTLNIDAGTGAFVGNRGQLSTTGTLVVQAGNFSQDGGTTSAELIRIDSATLGNQGGTIVQFGQGDTHIAVTGLLDNGNQGRIASNGRDMRLTAGTLRNVEGSIEHAAGVDGSGTLALTASDSFDNTHGSVIGNGVLRVHGGRIVNDNAGLLAAQLIGIDGTSLSNQNGGRIVQGTPASPGHGAKGTRDTTIAVTGDLNNDGGTISTQGKNLTLQAGATLSNRAGTIEHVGDGTLAIKADLFDDTTGSVLTNGALAIRGGRFVHDGSTTVVKQLDIDVASMRNQRGTLLQTGTGDTSIKVSGELDNTLGTLGSNGRNLTLSASTLINTGGQLQHAVNTANDGHGTLKLDVGSYSGARSQITANDALVIQANSFDNGAGNTGGLGGAISARRLTLDAQSFGNQGGTIVQTGTEATRITVAGLLDNSAGGSLASNGEVSITAASVNNQGGTLRAAGGAKLDLTVVGLVDNSHHGLISSGANTTVIADRLNNDDAGETGGVLAVGGLQLTLRGAVSNIGGKLGANGNTTITTSSLDSTRGSIAAVNGALRITTTGQTINDSGKMQAGSDLVLSNTGLKTVGGKVRGGTVQIDSHGNTIDTSRGSMVADSTLDILSGALVNVAGLIQSGGAMSIDTHGQALTNANTNINGQGGIVSGARLTLATGSVDNSAGFIGVAGDITATTRQFTNTQGGIVLSQGRLSVDTQGADYTNQGGQSLSLGDLAITTGAGTVNNNAGLIRSSATTTLRAARVVNANTLGTDQGIEGLNVVIDTNTLDNTSGAIRADQNTTITSAGSVNNSNGLISAKRVLSILNPQGASKTQVLTNTGGTLQGDEGVDIEVNHFSADGKVISGRDLNLAFNGDVTNNGTVNAQGSLTYGATGNVTNNGILHANLNLTVGGVDVVNNAGAEISAGLSTTVNASGTLTNRGLIDGVATRIHAGTLNNVGTGRLYGDRLSIAAGTVNNLTETVNGQIVSATIAARRTLDIGAGTLNNREHALIFSQGDMAIGGALDGNRQATGQAGAVNNASATIEALGNIRLAAARINNTNEHLVVERQVQSAVHKDEFQSGLLGNSSFAPGPASNFVILNSRYAYLKAHPDKYGQRQLATPAVVVTPEYCSQGESSSGCSPGFTTVEPSNSPRFAQFGVTPPPQTVPKFADYGCTTFVCPAYDAALSAYNLGYSNALAGLTTAIDGYNVSVTEDNRLIYQDRQWTGLSYMETVSKDAATGSDPAKIAAGGNLAIQGQLFNSNSQVVAGGQLSADQAPQNQQTQALEITHRAGTATHTSWGPRGGLFTGDRWYNNTGDYLPADIVVSTPLSGWRYESGVNAASGHSLGSVSSGPARSPADSAGQVGSGNGLHTIIEVPSAVGGDTGVTGQTAGTASGGGSTGTAQGGTAGTATAGSTQNANGTAAGTADTRTVASSTLPGANSAQSQTASAAGTRAQDVSSPGAQSAGTVTASASGTTAGASAANGAVGAKGLTASATATTAATTVANGVASASSATANVSASTVAAASANGATGAVGVTASTTGSTASAASSNGVNGTSGVTANASASTANAASSNSATSSLAGSASSGTGRTSPTALVVRTSTPGLNLPTASLYSTHAGPGSRYLIATDAAFTQGQSSVSSDALLTSLGFNSETTLKRLGDGFYEQSLIRDQILNLTGYRHIAGFGNDAAEYTALMNAGATFARQYGLRVGIALSAAQMAQLTSDIVWLVEQSVTLPDGSTERVLVPQVYVRVRPGDIDGSGALLSADAIVIKGTPGNSAGDLTNSGTLAGRTLIDINAETVNNLGGRITAGSVNLNARGDLNNIGGSITGANAVSLTAGRDITIESTTRTQTSAQGSRTNLDRIAGVYVTNPGGTLVASAGNDVNLIGAILANSGGGATSIKAVNDINLSTVTTANSLDITWDARNFSRTAESQDIGSQVIGVGAVRMTAGNDLNIKASKVASTDAALVVTAGRDIDITAGEINRSLSAASYTQDSGWFSKSSSTRRIDVATSDAVTSNLSGNTVSVLAGRDITTQAAVLQSENAMSLSAGRDLTLGTANQSATESHFKQDTKTATGLGKLTGIALGADTVGAKLITSNAALTDGAVTRTASVGTVISAGSLQSMSGRNTTVTGSTVVADNDVSMIAGNNFTVQSAQNTEGASSFNATRKSGMIGSTFNPSFGNVKQDQGSREAGVTQTASQIASLKGNVTLVAGNTYTQTASSVLAAGLAGPLTGGDVNILAKTVAIGEAYNTSNATRVTHSASTVLGGSASVAGISTDTLRGAKNTIESIGNTGDSRMKALGAVNLAIQGSQIATAAQSLASGEGLGFKVAVNLSRNTSESHTTQVASETVGSSITGAHNVNIVATGGGKDSNIKAVGSTITAGDTVNLAADNAIGLEAGKSSFEQHATNSSNGASIGVGFAVGAQNGFTIELGVSQGKGKGNASDVVYTNTQVSGGKTVNVISGGDLNLKGALIAAPKVNAEVGGDLNIQSLQDTSVSDAKQSSAGLNVSLCIPPICYGVSTVGVSLAAANAKGDFASVKEQSGIKAGDGGFNVNVAGNTDLKGGVISSTQAAIDTGTNSLKTASLTTSDIENRSAAKASSTAISVSSDMLDEGKYGATKAVLGNALDNGSASSSTSGKTRSAVSGGNVVITDEAAQLAATGKTASETVAALNRDTTSSNATVQKQDVKALQEQAQFEQGIKDLAVKQLTVYTDDAYKTMFKTEAKFYRVTCGGTQEQCMSDPSLVKMQEIDSATAKRDGKVLAANGILNSEDRAGQLAYQNASVDKEGDKPSNITLMHIAPAETTLGEMLVATYEQKLASTLGYTNADNTYADTLEGRGQEDTISMGHSRGTIVQTNAFNILGDKGFKNENLKLEGVGMAVSLPTYIDAGTRVMGSDAALQNITATYMANDPVSVIAAGNPGDAWAAFKEFANVVGKDNSAHSCYGSGAKGCTSIASPLLNGPQPINQNPSNIITYQDGQFVQSSGSK